MEVAAVDGDWIGKENLYSEMIFGGHEDGKT